MENLKPCPFCGWTPTLTHIGNDATRKRKVVIGCKKCNVLMSVGAIKFDMDWCETTAVENWNKRDAELEAKDKRIAELNSEVLVLAGKDLSTALKLTRRIDEIVEAGNGLIYNDSGTAPLYQPAVDEWSKVLSNNKERGDD